jgi:hypothetical protein
LMRFGLSDASEIYPYIHDCLRTNQPFEEHLFEQELVGDEINRDIPRTYIVS